MTLQAEVDSLESVPEALHELYTEKDGKWRLDLEGAHFPEEMEGMETAEAVAGLKTALAREKDRRRTAMERLKLLPDDFDPEADLEELAELRRDRDKRATAKAEEKGEWDKLKTQLQEGHQQEKDTWGEERGGLEGQLDEILRKNAAITALNDAEAHVEIMLPHVLRLTQTIKEDGKQKVIVVNDAGDRRLGKDGNDMTMEELVVEMGEQEKYAPGFKGSDATGGGATGRRAAGGGKHKALKDMTEAEKIEFTDEHGLEEYNKLVMEAFGQE